MQLDFINEIELQDFAREMRSLRAEDLVNPDTFGGYGRSDLDLADALKEGVGAGRISQNQLTTFLAMASTFDANSITPLNVKKGLGSRVNPLTGETEILKHIQP